MDKLVGVVNRPQFDMHVFEIGKAVHLRCLTGYADKLKSVDCIISETHPLYLIVNYYSEIEYEVIGEKINIDDVVNGEYTISLMKEEM